MQGNEAGNFQEVSLTADFELPEKSTRNFAETFQNERNSRNFVFEVFFLQNKDPLFPISKLLLVNCNWMKSYVLVMQNKQLRSDKKMVGIKYVSKFRYSKL